MAIAEYPNHIDEQVERERELSRDLVRFVGRWVAVQDHRVVADAPTLHELLERVTDIEVEGVFQVVEERTSACFF